MYSPKTIKVLLADLSYERKSLSPLSVPLAIGNIATYTKKALGSRVELKIVKSIAQFYSLIESSEFNVAGFSHYIWNANLSTLLAQHLKIVQPNCVIIFGGPHLPIHFGSQKKYLQSLPHVDFFIEKEGEIVFSNLVAALAENDLDVECVKVLKIKSVRCINNGEFLSAPLEDRIHDLDSIPSPYLSGFMDVFLEDGFTPIVENNRGCPFTCSYCGEGNRYHSKVAKHSLTYLTNEYDYIAKKMVSLKHLPFSEFLCFADSNTGMYSMDLDICRHLRELQKTYNWPRHILTSTSKNNVKRVIECIETLNGALELTASVQSTDPDILDNICRKNVSSDALMTVARGKGKKYKSFSEIILGLPGDSYEKHLKSIKDMIDLRVNELRLIQLIILPDAPMASPDYLEQFKMKTKFRLLNKGFARVKVGKFYKTAIEFEEICISTEKMDFQDYLKCRVAALLINVFYNNVFSDETFSLFEKEGLSVFEYMKTVIELKKPKCLAIAIGNYVRHAQDELFDSIDEIKTFLEKADTYERIRKGEIGINTTYFYTAQAKKCVEDIISVAREGACIVGSTLTADCIERDLCESNNWGLGIQRNLPLA